MSNGSDTRLTPDGVPVRKGFPVTFPLVWSASFLIAAGCCLAVKSWGGKWGALAHEKGFVEAIPDPAASRTTSTTTHGASSASE